VSSYMLFLYAFFMLLPLININAEGSKKGKKEAKQAKIFASSASFCLFLSPFRYGIFR
jgi:hypothetical protein